MTQVLPYASTTERRIAKKIVADALAAGYSVSVYDGEEWALKRSTDERAILAAMGSTDADSLRLRRADGTSIGTIDLVWGNDEDLVSDHAASEEMNAFIEKGRYC